MTFKNWCIDLWLDIRWGRWVEERRAEYKLDHSPGFNLAPIKAEGQNVMYDNGMHYVYYAVYARQKLEVTCESKRDAEGLCASMNDLRGTKKGGLITRL